MTEGGSPGAGATRPTLPSFDENSRRRDALLSLRHAFAAAGLDAPTLDARFLLLDALSIDATELALRPDEAIGAAGARRLREHAARRLRREPVSRILGEREFWGLPFALSPATLTPRPDTETLVETALSLLPDRRAQLRILDLGTGSGCLLVALLHELPNAHGVGVDLSVEALATARRNAWRNGIAGRASFVGSHWAAAIGFRFELVISNPPYIPQGDLASLPDEVRRHDPRAALDGGLDGLEAFRAILAEADGILAPAGVLVLEIGAGQESGVCEMAREAGLEIVSVASDLGGRPRAVALTPTGL